MQNLIKDNVGVLLKHISYDHCQTLENQKIDIEDDFTLIAKTSDIGEFELTRYVDVSLQTGYKLKIVAGLQVYAKDGVDFTKQLTDSLIEQNKIELSDTLMSYMSSLISQITASFNGYPIITAPTLQIKTDK